MPTALPDLDASGLLAAMADRVRARRLAEVDELDALGAWADLHSWDPTTGPDGKHQRRIGNVLRPVGGEGTPLVQDFCLGEIAMARGAGRTATTNLMADLLDLRHRLPLTWAVCLAGDAEVWVARRAAKLSRHVPADRAWVVDQAVARVIAHEDAWRTIKLAEAKVIEADPEAHAAKVAERKARRYVGLSRPDELGLRMVIAQIEAGDAAVLWALLELIADILATRVTDHAGGDGCGPSRDELRAMAFGYVVRPVQAIILILEHQLAQQATSDLQPEPVVEAPVEAATVEPEPEDEPEDVEPEPDPEAHVLHSAIAFPADLLEALKTADWSAWAPRCDLYVHLHQGTLAEPSLGTARVEGLGPMDLVQLQGLLAGANVTVKPVLDLSDRVRTTAYEHPESLKERVHLVSGGDYWPYATSTSRKVDYDHPTPYLDPDEGGPPGQTGTHNSGPLGRTHHRWKTHARYRARQSGAGRYVITTPHGLAYLRDHRGTRPIPLREAEAIIGAGDGVELYFPPDPDLRVEIDF
ncbi:hypothetical protein [Nocardioides marmoribigeumensis]|uniref:DUF222 domain-containing protein n=1 Tax=Nocardioides marmoribigeumensis TaxID=433649 RepID=A0ABU2BSJ6_9ACTN|nr:hypothetical protein [Nocardioides marmoribigeumensis]MDR7361610.1 hypothetical protein [Nocardioides marmoribigeumensis]